MENPPLFTGFCTSQVVVWDFSHQNDGLEKYGSKVNLLMQLVNTRLYLSSSRHAAWLLSVLHALLVPQPEGPIDGIEGG